jgi:hypothetical protein
MSLPDGTASESAALEHDGAAHQLDDAECSRARRHGGNLQP